MKFFSRKGFIVGMILLLGISEINGSLVRRRKRAVSGGGNNDLNWQTILDGVHKIPLIGAALYGALQDVANTVHKLDELTNGAISRIAGGYPPCIIDLKGIRCKGKPKDGGVVGITTELVNGTALPSLAKKVIITVLNGMVFPLFDVIVGIREKEGQKAN